MGLSGATCLSDVWAVPMNGIQSLAARVGLGVLGAGGSVVLASSGRCLHWPAARFDRAYKYYFVLSRAALFVVIFGLLRIAPRGDVPAIYTLEARQVLAGAMPYRDFYSSYAPLHAYLDAGLLRLWNSPLMLVLFAIAVEFATVWVFLRMGRQFVPETRLRTAALLYLFFPASLQFVAVDGQDSVLIALCFLLALMMIENRRWFVSGMLMGVALSVTKFLALLFVPLFLLFGGKSFRWLAGFLVAAGIGYVPFAVGGLPLLLPLRYEGSLEGSGNLPYLIGAVFGAAPAGRVLDGLAAAALLLVFGFAALRARRLSGPDRLALVTHSAAAMTLALLMFSKKSWPPYLMLTLFPICLALSWRGVGVLKIVCFEVFGVVAVAEHSYWSTLMFQAQSLTLHRMVQAGDGLSLGMLGVEILLVGGYAWLLLESIRSMWQLGSSEAPRVERRTQISGAS